VIKLLDVETKVPCSDWFAKKRIIVYLIHCLGLIDAIVGVLLNDGLAVPFWKTS